MLSMTAFANGENSTPSGRLTCEIKTVNQRFLEASVRVPEYLRKTEEGIRQLLKQRLARGKVSLYVRFFPDQDTPLSALSVNRALLRQVHECAVQVADTLNHDGKDLTLAQYMNWPDVVVAAPADTSALESQVLSLVGETLDELIAGRAREGASLRAALVEKVDLIEQLTAEIARFVPQINENLRTRLFKKLEDLDIEVNPERLEQELALQLQRIDIQEEIDRLNAHVSESRRVFELDEPVGRRLDFLVQEMHREANTIGSKSVSINVTNAGIDLKVAIEQIREQIQNIE